MVLTLTIVDTGCTDMKSHGPDSASGQNRDHCFVNCKRSIFGQFIQIVSWSPDSMGIPKLQPLVFRCPAELFQPFRPFGQGFHGFRIDCEKTRSRLREFSTGLSNMLIIRPIPPKKSTDGKDV